MKLLLTYPASNELKPHIDVPKRIYYEDLVLDDWLFAVVGVSGVTIFDG